MSGVPVKLVVSEGLPTSGSAPLMSASSSLICAKGTPTAWAERIERGEERVKRRRRGALRKQAQIDGEIAAAGARSGAT